MQAECKEQSGAEDTTPIFKGLRFALCSLEAKHVDAARAAIKMCGGRVTRVTDNLIDTTDEDVDWVITPLLQSVSMLTTL